MEYLDRLEVVSLKSCPWEKHVRDFSESQGGVRMQELDACRTNIDVPLGEIRVGQNQQIHDVGETERDGRQEDREEAHTFFQVIQVIDVNIFHDCDLKPCNIEELLVTSQVNW